jgi:hypothetical protein
MSIFRKIASFFSRARAAFAFSAIVVSVFLVAGTLRGQGPVSSAITGKISSTQAPPTHFRIGEKLTYNVSFGKFTNAAYIETNVVSRGKLSGQDAVEITSRVKTLGFVSAAFIEFDEDRTIYASPYTGLPLYVSRRLNNGPFPQETIGNYLTAPTSYYDPLSLVFKAREMGGSGSYSLFDKDNVYTVVFQPTVAETVKTEAGDFETVVSIVQSDFLAANGIKDLKINFSTDENHLPVLIRVRTAKGDFRASLLAVQLSHPTIVVPPLATPLPGPPATPKPKPTATPYIDNQPLSPELGFELGETLNYNLTEQGRPAGVLSLQAVERKQFQNEDSLLLSATITSVDPQNHEFLPGDYVHAQVDPETLAPRWVETRFNGQWKDLNQVLMFDRKTGTISDGTSKVEAPVGTHSILSLLYAMRSFNLRPSKDPNNPVNDTRVAVILNSLPHVFTLRPANPEEITLNGEKVPAQLVTINTADERIDKAGFKVWLASNGRYPVRMVLGPYQADLIQQAKETP